MRRFRWLILGLGLALAPGLDRPSAAATAPAKVGVGPAYEELGKLAVMHSGRIKPLDTMAREEVKQIFGRETIKLHDAKGEVTATWGPVAAFFDWSVRPDFWNDQSIILVDYLPLKRLLLAGTIEERLGAIAAKETTSPADRAAAKALMADRVPLVRRPVEVRPPGEAVGRGPDGDRSTGEPAGRGPPLDVRPRARGSRRGGGGPEGPLREVVPAGGGTRPACRGRPHRGHQADGRREAGHRGRYATGPFPDPSRSRDPFHRTLAGHAPAQ